ncbi:MAG: 2-amino-4-hydroxy-6-hydroxymethyldihydropteridine diphosphokinase [Desulfofustis sp.]|jgi:2-amino-4-hydroxy-6-hydroxymethyldihydropteridine diphosphokinase|nr:2-amino-4-hydroxy-6-hydroxymethyldihydropteridine diphosphokinase [Desulfofustis sp.]
METDSSRAGCDQVFVGFGSNLGDSRQMLLKAWRLLGERPEIRLGELSPPYRTSPVGMSSSHWFVNAVGRLSVTCSPYRLLDIMQEIEAGFGRERDRKRTGYQDRVIDLDLIYYGDLVCDGSRLTLPHPQRTERLFVLAPMAAIAPHFVDPEIAGKPTVSALHRALLQRIADKQVAEQELLEELW